MAMTIGELLASMTKGTVVQVIYKNQLYMKEVVDKFNNLNDDSAVTMSWDKYFCICTIKATDIQSDGVAVSFDNNKVIINVGSVSSAESDNSNAKYWAYHFPNGVPKYPTASLRYTDNLKNYLKSLGVHIEPFTNEGEMESAEPDDDQVCDDDEREGYLEDINRIVKKNRKKIQNDIASMRDQLEDPMVYTNALENIKSSLKEIERYVKSSDERITGLAKCMSTSFGIKTVDFVISNRNRSKVGFTGGGFEELEIPATFVGTDGINYKVVGIYDEAFEGCKNLKTVTIPNTVTSIGRLAFARCTALTEVNISKGVKIIDDGAFLSCTSLTDITLPNTITTIGKRAFCGSRLRTLSIPESVTRIGDNLCEACESLVSVDIHKSISVIGKYMFSGCKFLSTITIPDGIVSIRDGAFYNCISLASVSIPNTVTSIGREAFHSCISLKGIAIPEGVKTIEGSSFTDCTSLITANLPKSLTTIGHYAFQGCYGLTSIDIPEGVTSIGQKIFHDCDKLTSITIPGSVETISDFAFSRCKNLTEVNISEGVKTIADNAFSGCTKLATVNIPSTVTSIRYSAFAECTSLTSVKLPDGLKVIKANAFYGCDNLTTINIPIDTKVEENAFAKCASLTLASISDIENVLASSGGRVTKSDASSQDALTKTKPSKKKKAKPKE